MENNIYAKNESRCILQGTGFLAVIIIIVGMGIVAGGIQDIQRLVFNVILVQWFLDILIGFFMLFFINPSGINNGLIAVGFGLFLVIIVIIIEFYALYSKSASNTQKNIDKNPIIYKPILQNKPIIQNKMATENAVLKGFLTKTRKENNTQIKNIEGVQKILNNEEVIIKDSEKIFQDGLDKARKALNSKENGNYEEAIKLYIDAIKILAEFANYTKNMGLKNICTERINYYTERIMELKEKLANKSRLLNEKEEPIKILKFRLAKGEITLEEYDQLKNYLS